MSARTWWATLPTVVRTLASQGVSRRAIARRLTEEAPS